MSVLSTKSLLRNVTASCLEHGGLLAAQEHRLRDTLTVLCYHRVLPRHLKMQYFDPQLVVTPEMFDLHCATLARYYDVEPLDRALAAWLAGEAPDRPRAAITFDDGYRDNEAYAAPILARHELKATFYIVSGFVGSSDRPWYDRAGTALMRLGRDAQAEVGKAKFLSPLERQNWLDALEREAGSAEPTADDLMMDQAALRRLAAAGHEIGSHTVTHPLLDQLGEQERRDEIRRSRIELEAVTSASLSGFSYPNGNFDAGVKGLVSQAGYHYAVSADPGVNRRAGADTLALKRWFISEDRLADIRGLPSRALFRMEICGLSQRLFRRGRIS